MEQKSCRVKGEKPASARALRKDPCGRGYFIEMSKIKT